MDFVVLILLMIAKSQGINFFDIFSWMRKMQINGISSCFSRDKSKVSGGERDSFFLIFWNDTREMNLHTIYRSRSSVIEYWKIYGILRYSVYQKRFSIDHNCVAERTWWTYLINARRTLLVSRVRRLWTFGTARNARIRILCTIKIGTGNIEETDFLYDVDYR